MLKQESTSSRNRIQIHVMVLDESNEQAMEIDVSYYHILIEVNDLISTIEQTRDIEILDIIEIQPYLHSILLPYFNEQ